MINFLRPVSHTHTAQHTISRHEKYSPSMIQSMRNKRSPQPPTVSGYKLITGKLNFIHTSRSVSSVLFTRACTHWRLCYQWRRYRGFRRFNEPGPPSSWGPRALQYYILHHLQHGKVILQRTDCMKMFAKNASREAENAPESVWRPGSARIRWGSLTVPQTL